MTPWDTVRRWEQTEQKRSQRCTRRAALRLREQNRTCAGHEQALSTCGGPTRRKDAARLVSLSFQGGTRGLPLQIIYLVSHVLEMELRSAPEWQPPWRPWGRTRLWAWRRLLHAPLDSERRVNGQQMHLGLGSRIKEVIKILHEYPLILAVEGIFPACSEHRWGSCKSEMTETQFQVD